MKKIFFTIAAAVMFTACMEEKFEIAQADPKFDIVVSGQSILEGPAQEVEFEATIELPYTASGVSKVTATPPAGWKCDVRSADHKVAITAPLYADASKVNSGEIIFHLYDGTGSQIEKKLAVTATEGGMSFSIVTPEDLTTTQIFTKGSSTVFGCEMSSSVKTLEFQLPAGWSSSVDREAKSFRIISPLFTKSDDSEAVEGTVSVTPISWSDQKGEALTVSFEVLAHLVSTFEFIDTKLTFAYGETKTVNVTAPAIQSVSDQACPEGWTVDYTDIQKGTVKITAPQKGSAHVTYGSITAKGIYPGDTADSNELKVRLYGINNLDDLHNFLDAYGRANGAERGDISDYLIDGTIVLNNDITVPQEEFTSKAFLAYNLDMPLDGNNKTLNVTCEGPNGVVCLFQNLKADVKNLNIAGTMKGTRVYNAEMRIASLAAGLGKSGLTIENVNSSVNIEYSPTGVSNRSSTTAVKTYVSGLVGNSSTNIAVTYKNCSYSGTMTVNYRARAIGGIMAATPEGNYPTADGSVTRAQCFETKLDGCKFTGTINYNVTVLQASGGTNDRVGGLVGDVTRICVIDQSVSAGTININASSESQGEFVQSVGGVVGWKSDVAQLDINNTTTSTVMNVTNLNGSAQLPSNLTTYFDPIAGNTKINHKGYINCSNVICTGKVVYSYYNNAQDPGEITTSKHPLN